jgi:outer membrane receptor protein involved in Fe transport
VRRGFAKTETLPSYTSADLGVDQKMALNGKQELHLRIDVVNLFDKVYELRDGPGIGVASRKSSRGHAMHPAEPRSE